MSHTPRSSRDTERRRRARLIAIVVVVGVLAFVGGVVAASLRGGDDAGSPVVSTSPTTDPSPSATPSPSPSVSPSASPSGTAAPLPDGRHFGLLSSISGTEPALLSFDLAYWYTGDKANEVAASRGDETPVPNGYYIVNDNAKLRDLPLAPTVDVRYIPEDQCCELQPGTLDGLEAAVNGTAMTDYPDMSYTYWWITISNAQVVKIEQQYLP
jgi:hypothetical protein